MEKHNKEFCDKLRLQTPEVINALIKRQTNLLSAHARQDNTEVKTAKIQEITSNISKLVNIARTPNRKREQEEINLSGI